MSLILRSPVTVHMTLVESDRPEAKELLGHMPRVQGSELDAKLVLRTHPHQSASTSLDDPPILTLGHAEDDLRQVLLFWHHK
jgi:hypothetical protein